jgi:drug/metabolite transporter (DMT)-like permease
LPLLLTHLKQLRGILWPTLLAGTMIGFAFTLYANSLVETTVVRATLLFYLTPVWSTLIGVLWLSEKLTRARVLAIGVGLVGLLMLLSDAEAAAHPLNIGDLYGLLSGLFWAVCAATLNRWPGIPIMPLTTLSFILTAALSVVFAGAIRAEGLPELSMIAAAFPAAAFWSICVILPSFFVIFRVSQVLFPGRVGILMMSEVIVAILSASLLIPEETMLWLQWIGAAAIVAAGLIEVLFGYSRSDAEIERDTDPERQET